MKQIDESRLESDLAYRYEYVSDFMGFTEEDVALIHAAGPKLLPRIPELVEATYAKLLSYDATARHFLPRQFGYEGPLPDKLAELQNSEQIQFRKEHLQRYLMSIVGNSYDGRMVRYLDTVGKMHTPEAGNKQIDVPLVQMNALMGLLNDALMTAIYELELPRDEEQQTLRAFGKLLWIQNDLINRHYAATQPASDAHQASSATPPASAWK